MEFFFLGGSMGSVVGEKVTRAAERALGRAAAAHPGLDLRRRAHAGGDPVAHADGEDLRRARAALAEAGVPYISVMTDPTTGGVTASFAMLGDLNIAEPGALIGFAGPRVIEQTIRQTLPDGFQRSEFLLEHGMLDFVVERSEMKATARALPAPALGPAPRVTRSGATRAMTALATALARLEGLSPRGMRLGLEAIDAVCERLGRPERRVPSILVAGTNGKGSTAATPLGDRARRPACGPGSTPRRT